jgi:hypothetical protein
VAYRDLPPTDCVLCQQAEMTGWERAQQAWRDYWRGTSPLAAYGSMLRVMIGPSSSRYEQHRSMYMRTGDQVWLDRMLRHLEPEGDR